MIAPNQIRNIAIIAHVDHGKTTLVDKLLRQGGVFRANEHVEERVMDSMDLEREKGITIRAKNTTVRWHDYLINIVDTPGHADFGGEVERVLGMVDGVLLLVDAWEGPQAQTRFVLRKALSHGLRPIIVLNKIDRPMARPQEVHDLVLELLMELEATEDQFNAPFLYGSARDGYMCLSPDAPRNDLDPLFDTIVRWIPPPRVEEGQGFRMLVSNIDWDDYVGRVAVGKILSGEVHPGQTIYASRAGAAPRGAKVTKVMTYAGLHFSETGTASPGQIVGVAGFTDMDIGETLLGSPEQEPLPFVQIDPPTIVMSFAVNDGPLAGREGSKVTSRQIGERLQRESRTNISIKVSEGEKGGEYLISARGSMQIAVLVETMRREGFEVLVSRPNVIYKSDEEGKRTEPYETVWVDTPDDELGTVLKALAERKANVEQMHQHPHGTLVEGLITTRGLLGLEFELLTATGGKAVLSHLFRHYGPYAGPLRVRSTGTLVSIADGAATAYTLNVLQERGRLFIGPGERVYNGMIVGENPRTEDLGVNPAKEKQLSNVRSQGEGKGPMLTPPLRFSLERALEYIADDEYVEATPQSLRLRKKILNVEERRRLAKRSAQED